MALAFRRTLGTLLLASATVLMVRPLRASPPEVSQSEAEAEAETKARAKAEVTAAIAAFELGDHALALVHFEAAMALRPVPKLHYNLAVCHQRLSLQTDDPSTRTRHREQAIDSYNRYLELNPQAEDRREVATIVRELGGTPFTFKPIKPVFETHPEPTPVEAPVLLPPAPPPPPHHGRFGVLLGLGLASSLVTNRDIAAPALFMIDLHGGGFVGRQRRFLLAAQTGIFTAGSLRTQRLSFWGVHVGLLGEQQWVVARERLAIGLGGAIGLASQSVLQGVNAAPPICSVDNGTQVAGRNGGHFGARFELAALVGARRRGMFTVMLQPTVDVFGPPKKGQNCQPGQTPWEALNMTDRWQFLMFAGAGYSLRF